MYFFTFYGQKDQIWLIFHLEAILSKTLISPATPKAREGRYCNTPVRLSVRPSRLVFAL